MCFGGRQAAPAQPYRPTPVQMEAVTEPEIELETADEEAKKKKAKSAGGTSALQTDLNIPYTGGGTGLNV
tara:strand:- start:128 stop:337 length:210 start_codon:yes stop_codon:yes gene_type:complete